MHKAIARIDARLGEVAQTLQEQQNAHHAETLAVLRRVEAEIAELRGITTDIAASPEET